MNGGGGVSLEVGSVVAELAISGAWLIDPVAGREGAGEIVVRDGVVTAVTWLEGTEAEGVSPEGVIVAPGFVDLRAHLREPGREDAETVASGLAAAAHGGFTTVGVMPDADPPLDDPSGVGRVRAAARASGSPVEAVVFAALTAGRAGERLAALGELADAGVAGFTDADAPVVSAALLRSALAYAGGLGLPVVDRPADVGLAGDAEAAEGYVATVLGLRGVPPAAEGAAVARDLAVLADVVADVPGARLHLSALSTAGALDLVRRARARGLPVTCDVTPHHLALSDEWLAGARRWAWEGSGDPWADGALAVPPYDASLRVEPPLRADGDAAACLEALVDGTVDAVASDHAPWTEVDKRVEFGLAAPGIAGIETVLGLLLAAVDAGRLPLARAVTALTVGPGRIVGGRSRRRSFGLAEGEPADLVVFDRADPWMVSGDTLVSRARNTPLLGRELSGRVLLTIAGGRLAYAAE